MAASIEDSTFKRRKLPEQARWTKTVKVSRGKQSPSGIRPSVEEPEENKPGESVAIDWVVCRSSNRGLNVQSGLHDVSEHRKRVQCSVIKYMLKRQFWEAEGLTCFKTSILNVVHSQLKSQANLALLWTRDEVASQRKGFRPELRRPVLAVTKTLVGGQRNQVA